MFDQKIYFGAPGTGKSFEINKQLANIPNSQIFRVVIHPEYSYLDFIGQLLPYKDSNGTGFKFFPGVLTLALMKAYEDLSKDVYLVLEELSRGNVSAIFGDIFQLLDRNEKFESEYPIRNENITSHIPQITDDQLVFPSNFNILCSVNTNDQNVFPMDTAFKRRFDWIYVSPRPAETVPGTIDKKLNNPLILIKYSLGDFEMNWQSFYWSLNRFITDKSNGLGLNEDKQIGQFFIKFDSKDINASNSPGDPYYQSAQKNIIKIIKNKLLLYLWQDIHGVAGFSDIKLFRDDISNFDDLYIKYENDQVFSDNFISNYLIKDKDKFGYL
ncbi:TPA: AAA family ATPase [Streptococcus agalactiae]